MTILSEKEYFELRLNAEVLARDIHGDKVLRLNDGNILKLFRVKRILSSAVFYPYSARFVNNSRKLHKLNIVTIKVIKIFKIPGIKRTAVIYEPLIGDTFIDLTSNPDISIQALFEKLSKFISKLHEKGIYFRSLHLGNIIYLTNGNLGLIDISDMRIQTKPLSNRKRLRNFIHLLHHDNDFSNLHDYQKINFIDSYLQASGISNDHLKERLHRLLEKNDTL